MLCTRTSQEEFGLFRLSARQQFDRLAGWIFRLFLAFGVAAILTVPMAGETAELSEFSETECAGLADHPRISRATNPNFPWSSFPEWAILQYRREKAVSPMPRSDAVVVTQTASGNIIQ